MAIARIDFLWCVRMELAFCMRRSHSRMVLSWLPLMTCGSAASVSRLHTVCSCPDSTIACTHAIATAAAPHV